MSRFKFIEFEDDQKLSGSFVKYGHMLKKPENREIVEIVFRLLENVACEERNVSKTHKETVTHTFHSFKHDFFVNIEWIDPRNVLGRNYGVPMIEFLSEKFNELTKGSMQQNLSQISSNLDFSLKQPKVQNLSQI